MADKEQPGAEEAPTHALATLVEAVGEDRVNLYLKFAKEQNQDESEWMTTLLPHLTYQSCTYPSSSHPHHSMVFTFVPQPHHSNRLGNMHGGCIATLFDFCTTLPLLLVAKPGFWMYMGVSRTLNVTYLRPVPIGTEVEIEAEILQVGRRLATLKGIIRRKDDGAVCAIADHGKVNTDPEVGGKI